ncbi:MAG TPA: hypothetical protein P5543_09940 [Planctomycetota bacterium]|nr:hypothetical protein [Planctomycetota bacterium]
MNLLWGSNFALGKQFCSGEVILLWGSNFTLGMNLLWGGKLAMGR